MKINKVVTNEEFNKAKSDINNIKIIKKVTGKYANSMSPNELESCGDVALWQTLSHHEEGRGNKFTSSLWRFVDWECKKALQKLRRYRLINFSELSDTKSIDTPTKETSDMIGFVYECMDKLHHREKKLIQEYYIDKYTLEELSREYGCSKETISNKISKALSKLKKLCNI